MPAWRVWTNVWHSDTRRTLNQSACTEVARIVYDLYVHACAACQTSRVAPPTPDTRYPAHFSATLVISHSYATHAHAEAIHIFVKRSRTDRMIQPIYGLQRRGILSLHHHHRPGRPQITCVLSNTHRVSSYEYMGFVGEHQTSIYRGHMSTKFAFYSVHMVAHSPRVKCIILTLH